MIKLIFDDVNKLVKFKSCKLYISEFTVLVKVSIDNLNELSNPMSSRIRKLDKNAAAFILQGAIDYLEN